MTDWIDWLEKPVSIHAPTRGATKEAEARYRKEYSFNPRTHAGCDYIDGDNKNGESKFQSTHPRGVRLFAVVGKLLFMLVFQSTHPRGVRPIRTRFSA